MKHLHRHLRRLGALGLLLPAMAAAAFDAQRELDGQRLALLGAGTASYMLWKVYDAALYAPAGADTAAIRAAEVPMSLILEYHRDVGAADIREATWVALERQYDPQEREALRPKIEAIQSAMVDVSDGDRYRLDWQPAAGRLVLSLNGEPRFESDDRALARAYFGIWLGEPPLSESLRDALLARSD
jgi:hypothetical protein